MPRGAAGRSQARFRGGALLVELLGELLILLRDELLVAVGVDERAGRAGLEPGELVGHAEVAAMGAEEQVAVQLAEHLPLLPWLRSQPPAARPET